MNPISIGWAEFLTILMLVFALCLLIAGIFTAYFGSGKSRKIGIALSVFGILIAFIWSILTYWRFAQLFGISSTFVSVDIYSVVLQSTLILVSAIIGALAAVGIFLLAIMKS
ncbi:MAG: hypothetical protein HZB92_05330 [Euryarchaeota archaeon]|nr:hypothetical protein [Euryarchaeota archaeon]